MARGLRLSTELVAGVLVGAAIGWLIDRFVGTSPWGFIVFLLLGFAAGILNVMRAAGVIAGSKLDPPGSKQ
jgi:ATP synthase protein I